MLPCSRAFKGIWPAHFGVIAFASIIHCCTTADWDFVLDSVLEDCHIIGGGFERSIDANNAILVHRQCNFTGKCRLVELVAATFWIL